jgi:hypothetical protein
MGQPGGGERANAMVKKALEVRALCEEDTAGLTKCERLDIGTSTPRLDTVRPLIAHRLDISVY